jgi:hypothetical protein
MTVTAFPFGVDDVTPYFSVTPAHLDAFLSDDFGNLQHYESLGGSFQVGVGFQLNKNAQFFFQYRYFKYTTLLEGQLTQFGIMYTFGG